MTVFTPDDGRYIHARVSKTELAAMADARPASSPQNLPIDRNKP
jgi:hypothetical protein